MSGHHFPSSIAGASATAESQPQTEPDVGEILRRLDASRQLSGAELEQHIADCSALWQRAYGRFQAHGSPTDRDEAVLWLHRMNEAILMRPAGVQAQRHAAFERRLAAGIDRGVPLRRSGEHR